MNNNSKATENPMLRDPDQINITESTESCKATRERISNIDDSEPNFVVKELSNLLSVVKSNVRESNLEEKVAPSCNERNLGRDSNSGVKANGKNKCNYSEVQNIRNGPSVFQSPLSAFKK